MPGCLPCPLSPVGVHHGVSTHRVRSSGVGCPAVRGPVNWLHRLGSGRPAVWCPPVRGPAVRCPPVRSRPSPPSVRRRRWGPGRCSGATVMTATGRAPCGLPRPRAARSTAAQAWDAGATAQVVRRSAGRRPRPGRMVLRLGRRPRSTAAPTGQGGQPTVRGARWWRLRQGRGAGCSATFPHLPRGGRPGLAARPRCVVVMEPGARSGRPGRANELAGEDGVRPSAAQACTERHGPGAGSALSWETVVGATGFEPVTSSVSDPRDHFQGGIPRHYRP
jgi:hypothetical protein